MLNIIHMGYKDKLVRLGTILKSQRNLLKLTVREVSDKTTLDKNTISRIERGFPCRSDSISIYWNFLEEEITKLEFEVSINEGCNDFKKMISALSLIEIKCLLHQSNFEIMMLKDKINNIKKVNKYSNVTVESLNNLIKEEEQKITEYKKQL